MRYKGRDDMLVMQFAAGTTVAGVFTRSSMPGAPVEWCRKILPGGSARALVVNAGIANVFTGKAGQQAVKATADGTARALGCKDRKSVVEGKRGSVRVDIGGRRIIKKKKIKKTRTAKK